MAEQAGVPPGAVKQAMDHSAPGLRHMPIGLFAMVMGLAGLSLAAQKIEQLLAFPPVISRAALLVAIAVFVTVAFFYALKALRHPDAVQAEWNHPVRIAFFPAISVGMILIGTALFKQDLPFALPIWLVGTALNLTLALAVISAWIGHRPFQAVQLNPAWFIPAVGNVLVPIAGVPLGFVELSWLFFTIGIMFWLILVTLVFNRLVFHDPLPGRLVPTLAILIAPPAVGFLAWTALAGGLDAFGRILFHAAILFTLLVLAQARSFVRLPFALSWWALSFPVAALTVAALTYAELSGATSALWVGFAAGASLCVIIALLGLLTTRAFLRNEVCVPE